MRVIGVPAVSLSILLFLWPAIIGISSGAERGPPTHYTRIRIYDAIIQTQCIYQRLKFRARQTLHTMPGKHCHSTEQTTRPSLSFTIIGLTLSFVQRHFEHVHVYLPVFSIRIGHNSDCFRQNQPTSLPHTTVLAVIVGSTCVVLSSIRCYTERTLVMRRSSSPCINPLKYKPLITIPDAYNNHKHTYDINEEHTQRLSVVVRVSGGVFDSLFSPAKGRCVRVESRRDV